MDILQSLTHSDNSTIALLAMMVIVLSGTVAYQWKYTANKTVPKWIWDALITKIDAILEVQRTMSTVIDERLKK